MLNTKGAIASENPIWSMLCHFIPKKKRKDIPSAVGSRTVQGLGGY
jgi:hypothetical protein